MRSEVLAVVIMKSFMLSDIMLCNLLKVNQCFEGDMSPPASYSLLHDGFLFGFNPEAGSDMFSETSVDSQQITRRYVPEVRNL